MFNSFNLNIVHIGSGRICAYAMLPGTKQLYPVSLCLFYFFLVCHIYSLSCGFFSNGIGTISAVATNGILAAYACYINFMGIVTLNAHFIVFVSILPQKSNHGTENSDDDGGVSQSKGVQISLGLFSMKIGRFAPRNIVAYY